jgi:hypothetical protein
MALLMPVRTNMGKHAKSRLVTEAAIFGVVGRY